MRVKMIGKPVLCVAAVFLFSTAQALAQISVQASVDRNEVGQDESVAFKISIEGDKLSMDVSDPAYRAPDFEELQSFQSASAQSIWVNGQFEIKNTIRVTKILKPLKTGKLKITDIQVRVGGKTYTAGPVEVNVVAAGSATPPPSGYGGTIGLRGATKIKGQKAFFVRAEINKSKLFKGEQVIVSYYLYRSTRLFNIEVGKYPILKGFLREDLELPVQRAISEGELVTVDGMSYRKILLARYAAYPLQEGKLQIDSLSLKASYYAGNSRSRDQDDLFSQFFSQLNPQSAVQASELVPVEVRALPDTGKPSNFSGGVGDFTVDAAVNQYEVKSGEALTLTVKVEGRGNVSAISEPKLELPSTVEVYETKGTAKTGVGGIGQKVFEILLIPRAPGPITLPPISFVFFNPEEEKYVTRSTAPIQINVLPGAQGLDPATPTTLSRKKDTQPAAPAQSRVPLWKDLGSIGGENFQGQPWWRWMYWLSFLSLAFFVAWVAKDRLARWQRNRSKTAIQTATLNHRQWDRLLDQKDCVVTYAQLSEIVLEALENATGMNLAGFPRMEWAGRLEGVAASIDPQIWQRLEAFFDFADWVKFSGQAANAENSAARTDLKKWVTEAKNLVDYLNNNRGKNPTLNVT